MHASKSKQTEQYKSLQESGIQKCDLNMEKSKEYKSKFQDFLYF